MVLKVRFLGKIIASKQAAKPEEAVAYVSFIPSAAKMNGLLHNEVIAMALRTKWLHDYLNVPSDKSDDTPLRLSLVESLVKKLKR